MVLQKLAAPSPLELQGSSAYRAGIAPVGPPRADGSLPEQRDMGPCRSSADGPAAVGTLVCTFCAEVEKGFPEFTD